MKTIVILSHVIFDNSPYCIFVHEHAKALKKAGYNVIVFALLNWFPFSYLIKKNRKDFYKKNKGTKLIDGITVIYKKRLSFSNLLSNSKINLNGFSYFKTIKKELSRILKNEDVVLIDAHMFKIEGYAASLIHKKYKLPTIVTCHGTSLLKTLKSKNSNYIISKIIRNVDYAVCVSDLLTNKLKEKIHVNNVKTIYNGINFYSDNKEDKIKNRDVTILTVATLIPRKNVDLVIQAFKIISDQYNSATLHIIGEGIERNRLELKTKELNLENKVKFLGQVDNKSVYEQMKRSKIFLLPSVNEGFGIVYAEAMYNGCFTVGTKEEGIDGFIKDQFNGFLIEPNVEDIFNKVSFILKNESKLQNIKEQAMKDASNLSWHNNAKEYIKLINKLGKGNG